MKQIYSKKNLNILDTVVSGTAIIISTYYLCSSTYLLPFIGINTTYLIASKIARKLRNEEIITEQLYETINSFFVIGIILITITGCQSNAYILGRNIRASISGLSFGHPYIYGIATGIANIIFSDLTMKAIVVSGIPKLCRDVVHKIDLHENKGDKSITFSVMNSIFACATKYCLWKVVFKGNLFGMFLGGVWSSYYLYNKEYTPLVKAGILITDSLCFLSYSFLSNEVNMFTDFVASMGIEVIFNAIHLEIKHYSDSEKAYKQNLKT